MKVVMVVLMKAVMTMTISSVMMMFSESMYSIIAVNHTKLRFFSDLLLWETDISAMGVRHYPGNIGWGAAMTVEDRSDVGSYWSGEGHNFNDQKMKTRPRRVNSLIGQQAGWMATRSQILYFHEHACPGGFLPPF